MAHLSGTDRSQLLLLPEAVDDNVGPENPVRFIEAFVNGLDLFAAGFVVAGHLEDLKPGSAPSLKVKGFGCRQAYESLSCRNPQM
jgi:hypothetical protein